VSEAGRLKEPKEGVSPDPVLYDAMHAVAGEKGGGINSRRLGRYIKRHDRRIEDGMSFEDCGEEPSKKVRMWRVTGVSGVSGVSSYEPACDSGVEKGGLSAGTDPENPSNPGCPRCGGEGCGWCGPGTG